jgi:hypothetical protein
MSRPCATSRDLSGAYTGNGRAAIGLGAQPTVWAAQRSWEVVPFRPSETCAGLPRIFSPAQIAQRPMGRARVPCGCQYGHWVDDWAPIGMTDVRMPVFLRPLAIPIIDDLLAGSRQSSVEVVALELLVGFVGERGDPVEVVRGRYRQVTDEEKEPVVVPQHESLMRHIVRPLLEAKQCYILRMPVACIAQAGLVGEMVALWRFRMLQTTIDGRAFTEEVQKLILGREFDKLGQEERVRVLRGLEEVEPDVVAAFGELRALRRKYLHFMVDPSVDVDADARRALSYAALLVVRTLGVTLAEGKLVLPERVARYIADIVRVDASEAP